MRRARITALILASVLLSACAKVNTDPMSGVNGLHARAARIRDIYVPALLPALDQIKALPEIAANPDAVKVIEQTKDAAKLFADNAVPLADLIISLSTIDASNKADVLAKLAKAKAAWDALAPLLSRINGWIAGKVTNNQIIQTAIVLAPTGISIALGLVASAVEGQ